MSVNIKTLTGLLEIAGNGVAHWTGTREQYELDKDQIPDGTYVDITDDYTIPSDKGEVYSEEETLIGTWFGKPLYRKVIEFRPSSSTYQVQQVPHNIANVENICRYEMFLVFSSGMVQPIPGSQFTSSGINVGLTNFCDVNKTYIETIFGYDRSSSTVRTIIEYTKVGD